MKTILWTCDTCWSEQELIAFDSGDITPAVCNVCNTEIDSDKVAQKMQEYQKDTP